MGRHPLRQGCICTDLQKGIYPTAAKFISVSPLLSCSFSSRGKKPAKRGLRQSRQKGSFGRERGIRRRLSVWKDRTHFSSSFYFIWGTWKTDIRTWRPCMNGTVLLTKSLETNFALDTTRIGTGLAWEMNVALALETAWPQVQGQHSSWSGLFRVQYM